MIFFFLILIGILAGMMIQNFVEKQWDKAEEETERQMNQFLLDAVKDELKQLVNLIQSEYTRAQLTRHLDEINTKEEIDICKVRISQILKNEGDSKWH